MQHRTQRILKCILGKEQKEKDERKIKRKKKKKKNADLLVRVKILYNFLNK